MIDYLLTFLLLYKYFVIFGVSFLSAFLLPVPASTVIVASGALAAQGYMSISKVLAVALLGNVLADMSGYALARYFASRVSLWRTPHRVMQSGLYKEMSNYMHAYPHILIFITRFISEAGPMVNFLSGINRIRFRTFLMIDLVGESAYVSLYGLSGYFLGDAWEDHTDFLWKGTLLVILFALVVWLLQIVRSKNLAGRQ
jgi:membrane-associated protein